MAIEWGVSFGAYNNYGEARSAYFALREKINPQTQREMQQAWWQQVNDIADDTNTYRDHHDNEALACIYGYDGPIY
jgi:hypothetical protein